MTTQIEPNLERHMADRGAILSMRDLTVHFRTEDGVVKAVDGLSFDLTRGKTLGIVGESGSGKSVATMAILGLHNRARASISGQILFEGTDLAGADERAMRQFRGKRISMIFQDPLTALSPYYTVGDQIMETYRRHTGADRKRARARAIEMLTKVGIPQPERRVDDYPHQFSGGMRQRAMIAIALCCDPDLLIADEPTTALDVTVQAQILDLLRELQSEFDTAIILITHDMGVVAQMADDVLVMYAGRCVERGTVREVLKQPRHPYSWGLLSSIPHLGGDVDVPLTPVRGTPPSLIDVPSGCPFHPRCDFVDRVGGTRCTTERPLVDPDVGHGSACHLATAEAHRIFVDEIQPALGTGKAS
ncbi:ABC transporter ATP-binding protein [Nocardia terpenica]|uniref:ATP-binding cassette domain-containing protein n=1 Tax=Nocardia terpenica TaxID=455432 RepID=A0A6G9Z458_9NOCA|nr:ABC transporter ATP-binding protein [Nocardia terpenica]QIS19976.1 ATP-binding cassette domain-containing protein [Nocardia terpenica]